MARVVDKNLKLQQILDAAIRVLARKGAADTKIEDIANEAQIAKGTIYLYFNHKNEIFEGILNRFNDQRQDLHKILKSPQPPKEKIRQLVLNEIGMSYSQGAFVGLYLEILAYTLRNDNKAYQNNIRQQRMAITSLILQHGDENISKSEALNYADVIGSFIQGQVIQASVAHNKKASEIALDTLLDMILVD